MPFKIFAGVVAIVLMVAFLVPLVFKLKEISLGVVAAIGVGLALRDLWESLRASDS